MIATSQLQSSKSLSLLERIKQAQERERQASSSLSRSTLTTKRTVKKSPAVVLDTELSATELSANNNLSIPNYAETATHQNVAGGMEGNGESTTFSNVLMGGLSTVSGSLNGTVALGTDVTDVVSDNSLIQGLLADSAEEEGLVIVEEDEIPMVSLGDNYTMSAYFRMFVTDAYRLYRRLTPPARVILATVLLWILWELL